MKYEFAIIIFPVNTFDNLTNFCTVLLIYQLRLSSIFVANSLTSCQINWRLRKFMSLWKMSNFISSKEAILRARRLLQRHLAVWINIKYRSLNLKYSSRAPVFLLIISKPNCKNSSKEAILKARQLLQRHLVVWINFKYSSLNRKLMSSGKHCKIHNLKCFLNWTVTELRVLAILSRIYYFAIFDDKSWLFFTENPLFGHNFWKKKPRTCNLSTVQNQLLRVPIPWGIKGWKTAGTSGNEKPFPWHP